MPSPLRLRNTIFLGTLVSWGPFVYPIIALAIFFEGEAVIFSTMFLVFEKILNPYITIPLIFVSVILTDFISYQIGKHGPRFLPRLAHYYEKLTEPLDSRLQNASFSTYLISKFTYGMHRAVLIKSGMIQVPFKKFARITCITSTIWIVVISAVSFASWKSVEIIGHSLRFIEIGLLVGVIVILVGSHLISHFAKAQLLK